MVGTNPDPVNVVAGQRLRLKREMAGISQTVLGQVVNVSRIKIGQFESGQSAIPASMLYKFAKYFDVNINYFFASDEDTTALDDLERIDPMLNKLSLSLLRDFNAMEDPVVRKNFARVMERAASLLKD